GGYAYFDLALPSFKQQASYFALQNDFWTLAALDTAYADHDLYGDQIGWLKNLLEQGSGRRLGLFTHHQPVSLFEMRGSKLIRVLNEMLQDARVYAWYWGHETACIMYDRHAAWGVLGRCAGFGGLRYLRKPRVSDTSSSQVRWVRLEPKDLIQGGQLLDGPNP